MLAIFILAASSTAADMYSCITPDGRRLSRDRLIDECAHVTQLVRRANGTVERIPSEEERARIAEAASRAELKRQEQVRESLANRLLLSRFPNEAAHDKRRDEDLSAARAAIRAGEVRTAELEVEHRKIERELEFYPPGHPAPASLIRRAEANDGARLGQKQNMLAQQREVERINARLDLELAKLKTLWGKSEGAATEAGPAGK